MAEDRDPRYDPAQIEEKWQQRWAADPKLYAAEPPSAAAAEPALAAGTPATALKPKYYVLEMLPYPSGQLHMGHVRNYSIGDALARHMWMRGFNVLHPMGWDAFGLPAENAALKNNTPPREWTLANIAAMKRQMQRLGFGYDWATEVTTCLPDYYRWNQWFFLRMYEKGLVYRKQSKVNWCPECATVLANEQVIDGCCWRHESTRVEQRDLEQWFLRITKYAQELLDGLDNLDGWPEKVRTMQRNWIGRSEGAEIEFRFERSIKDMLEEQSGEAKPNTTLAHETIRVFTTRIDTIFGATSVQLAPEHPLVTKLAEADHGLRHQVARLIEEQKKARESGDLGAIEKHGVPTGHFAVNPYNNELMPVWVANYVLMDYGTGAIMSVPAHDERDYDFAKKYALPIRRVIAPADAGADEPELPFVSEDGILVNSGPFGGLSCESAQKQLAEIASSNGFGKPTVTFRLKDWGISRQRYWGTPIPMIHCEHDGLVAVPDESLPVLLPENIEITQQGGSPLGRVADFVNVTCPKCGRNARRETDTMDTFVDSSWYFYRYTDAKNSSAPFDSAIARYWFPIDQYIGGVEHAILHLIYSRFWTRVMRDLGLISNDEPARRLFTQGMVIKDGAKMSKSRGNVVSPDDMVARYGADATRMYALFAAPPDRDLDWQEDGVAGISRFLGRVYRLVTRYAPNLHAAGAILNEKGTGFSPYDPAVNKAGASAPEANPASTLKGRDFSRAEEGPMKGTGFSPYINATQSSGALAPEANSTSESAALKGHDFSRAVSGANMSGALAPEANPASTLKGHDFSRAEEGPMKGTGFSPYINATQSSGALAPEANPVALKLLRKLHQAIAKITLDFEGRWHFNTCVAAIMELVNEIQAADADLASVPAPILRDLLRSLVLLLAPFAPFLAAELWEDLGEQGAILRAPWPQSNPELAKEDELEIPVQINGKLVSVVRVPADATRDQMQSAAFADEKIRARTGGKTPAKVIVVPGKLVNLVVK